MPPHIATWPFRLTTAAAAAVSRGDAELQSLRADGGTPGGVHSLAETLLRSESAASSRIEGLQMTHARITRARHGGSEDKTARDMLANIAAMREAIDLGARADHVSVYAIKRIHKELLPENVDNDGQRIGGRLRATQNWIGRSDISPVGATFVPPPPEFVDELLVDLGDFIDRTDLPAIAQAAIAHAQEQQQSRVPKAAVEGAVQSRLRHGRNPNPRSVATLVATSIPARASNPCRKTVSLRASDARGRIYTK